MVNTGLVQGRAIYVSHKGIRLVRSLGKFTIADRQVDGMHLAYYNARTYVVPYGLCLFETGCYIM